MSNENRRAIQNTRESYLRLNRAYNRSLTAEGSYDGEYVQFTRKKSKPKNFKEIGFIKDPSNHHNGI